MKNFSFKQFVENKDLNEVGQHVYPDEHNDPTYNKPFHNITVKQVENGGYADTENKFSSDMPVLKVKNIKDGIEVELGGMIKSRLLEGSDAINSDPRTGSGMLGRGGQIYDFKDDKYGGFYKGVGKSGGGTNETIDIILKSMMKVAAQIIIDHHQYSRIISFKPVFDWLQNPRPDRDVETRIALMYTTLDKGLKMIIREASQKINSGRQNWNTKYNLEKVGHDIHISSGSPSEIPLHKDTGSWDKAVAGDKETNQKFAARRRGEL